MDIRAGTIQARSNPSNAGTEQLAHRELTEILCDIDPKSLVGGVALRHLKVEDETWARLLEILYIMAVAEDWPDIGKLKAWLSDEVMPLLAFAIDGADVAIRAEEQVEVMAAAAEVDGLHGDDVIEPEATSEAEVSAAVDAPTLPEVKPSIEAEAEPAQAVEAKVDPTPDVVVTPKPKRFSLTLPRSPDVTASALAADMAGQANRAAPSAIGSNGPA